MTEDVKRISIVYGHLGSGKSEFAANYAIYLRKKYNPVAIIDLDTISMYFRVRGIADVFKEHDIELLATSLKSSDTLDIPALDARNVVPFQNKAYHAVVDTGGDPKGTLILRYYKEFLKNETETLYVMNANRQDTSTADKVQEFMENIAAFSGKPVDYIVNTTHMLRATTPEDILRGAELAEEVSKTTGVPIKYHVGLEPVVNQIKQDPAVSEDVKQKLFPIKLYLRSDWMV